MRIAYWMQQVTSFWNLSKNFDMPPIHCWSIYFVLVIQFLFFFPGAPLFLSHPHFRRGDPSLFNYIEGLEPDKFEKKTYVNLHPLMGFAMTCKLVSQVNIQVRKPYGVPQLDMFKDNTMLPMVWIETVSFLYYILWSR